MPYISEMKERAQAALLDIEKPAYLAFNKDEMEHIKKLHNGGGGGLEIASFRSAMIDTIIEAIFLNCLKESELDSTDIAVLAVGGYGRGLLNPSSDIDLLFILPVSSNKLKKNESAFVESILYQLWDLGLKLGHATRSVNECISEGKKDQQTKTALMDARKIVGVDKLVDILRSRFNKECISKNQEAFFDLRRQDIRSRHRKYSHTVFLQEPHVKESCGGLRDYHNVKWIARVKRGFTELSELVKERILTRRAEKAMEEANDFLHRVRNALHFHTGKSTDILTLQLQGVVATQFNYPEKSILRRCESFMRDYYRHTKALYQHTTSLFEIFQIEYEEQSDTVWHSWLTKRRKKREVFDGFISRSGRIYLDKSSAFEDDSHNLMKVFLYCQQRELRLSPQIRKQIKAALPLVDKTFRYDKKNREAFRAMLERKGEVATTLRRMHRVGFLGAYLPEFGAMDCLVQHEFFHRYTADEHTLRCIDQLDALVSDESRERDVYRQLLADHKDPYALYLALILHDSGRAENVREHIDGSALLASRVCSRLQIRGQRRQRITFLVDHHLTFWRTATGRNLEDPNVIEEFAKQMGNKDNLNALFLFTYADSNGTNEEAWSPWKETLMLQLYRSTFALLDSGRESYEEELKKEKEAVRKTVKGILKEKYHKEMNHHFERMPNKYFMFREARNIAIHIRAARRFRVTLAEKKEIGYNNDMRWIDHDSRGYTELIITTWNRPLLLEKACCALASEEINIISADVFTRTDHVVCDIFRVCTVDWLPITDKKQRKRVQDIFTKLLSEDGYDPSKYLKRKKNLLRKDKNEGGIPFPVRAYVNNRLSETCTAIEVQAQDRIGLLHDLFLAINSCGLATVHARICTEKGAAMDTIYVSYPEGGKVEDPEMLDKLQTSVNELVDLR